LVNLFAKLEERCFINFAKAAGNPIDCSFYAGPAVVAESCEKLDWVPEGD
jgi:hypothetical protein